jgi:ubiquitin-protein ligase
VQEDIFEWQFAILGPQDSEFEGGIYHGRIQLPSDYPFKPPSFMLLTVCNLSVTISFSKLSILFANCC